MFPIATMIRMGSYFISIPLSKLESRGHEIQTGMANEQHPSFEYPQVGDSNLYD